MNTIYRYYMQRVDSSLSVIPGSKKDLEKDFNGLFYLKSSGLESRGTIKNIYTESYAESDTLRVYHPSDNNLKVKRDSTEVSLNLLFLGINRRRILDSFIDYICSGRLYYWDNVRHRKALLLAKDDIKVEEDYLGSKPYIKLSIRFDNLWGEAKACNDQGTLT